MSAAHWLRGQGVKCVFQSMSLERDWACKEAMDRGFAGSVWELQLGWAGVGQEWNRLTEGDFIPVM